jgi:geranylgeranyl reductase family protein
VDTCDVLIVGGGPAGSSCARALTRAGMYVVVIDRAVFPRDKVCAGWITPEVVAAIDFDSAEYARSRTFQPVIAFRTGLIGGRAEVETTYASPVSFGIRRREFDHYLLERCGADLRLGQAVSTIERVRDRWIVNGAISAPMLVGAGGHFCPVARRVDPQIDADRLVVARETEFWIDPEQHGWRMTPGVPEIYFCRDLKGYGWCFLKGAYLNLGLGRFDRRSLGAAVAAFVAFLRQRQKIPDAATWRWCGHAYLVRGSRPRGAAEDAVLLAGDAAGLAAPESGEGIWPAIRSGLLAAATIVDAQGTYTRDRLAVYEQRLTGADGRRSPTAPFKVDGRIGSAVGRSLLHLPWFVRHVVLDRWFLHGRKSR